MSATERRWLEVGVRCAAEDLAPLLVEGLVALGGRAVEERAGWYLTHLECPEDLESFEVEARAALASWLGAEHFEFRTAWRDEEQWEETWKRGLGFRRITDRLAVRPSWVSEPADRPEIVVVLDPGMAFGTAEHGTTRGCLRLLDRAVSEGDRVLDVGAGSGILSIAVALLGAAEVLALEGDPLACEALAENLDRNGVADRVSWLEGTAGADEVAGHGPADGIVANIESATLRGLLPGFAEALAPQGWLILSGILGREWPGLRADAEVAGFRLLESDEDGDWRAGLFRRRGRRPTP